ncbi:hypothetical protein LTR12_016061 [Friedmanniomyces endolithicus]|nr:hypothetical protein LTR12_016061 [Friedmanniomyces endolithicus]
MCNKQHGGRLQQPPWKWILASSIGEEGPYEEIVIQTGYVHLQVVLPNHAHPSPRYRKNLEQLYRECQNAARCRDDSVTTLKGLALSSYPSTAAPSGAITPATQSLYYRTAMLGSGQYGEVSLVIDGRTGQYYAAKIFHHQNKKRHADDNEAWRKKIQQEFKIAVDSTHDNIVKAFELREDPMTIVMEYYTDGNIGDAAKDMSEIDFVSAFGQILCGLQHLHDQGVVHRDLKPENFLIQIRPFFKVAIADFGLANIVQSNRLLSTFCGTLKYAAPEVFPGLSARHNSRADIWSLGVIMLEWMYGIPEDEDDCTMTDLLLCMVNPMPHGRWSAEQCLQHGFDNCLFRQRKYDGLVVCINDPTDAEADLNADHRSSTGNAATTTTNSASTPTAPAQKATFSTSTFILDRGPPASTKHTNQGQELLNHVSTRAASFSQDDSNGTGCDVTESMNGHEQELPTSRRAVISRFDSVRARRIAPIHSVHLQETVRGDQPSCVTKPFPRHHTVARNNPQSPARTPKKARIADHGGASDDVDTLSEASHLSTRDVIEDRNLAYVRVRVSMRLSDYHLNASEILMAADVDRFARRNILTGYESKGIGQRQTSHRQHSYWLPFPYGVQLCRDYSMDRQLSQLFARSPRPLPALEDQLFSRPKRVAVRLPEGFEALRINNVDVVYKRDLRVMNAAHLWKASKHKGLLRTYIKSQAVAVSAAPKGNCRTQGTYLTFEAARALCNYLKLQTEQLWAVIADEPGGGSNARDGRHADGNTDSADEVESDDERSEHDDADSARKDNHDGNDDGHHETDDNAVGGQLRQYAGFDNSLRGLFGIGDAGSRCSYYGTASMGDLGEEVPKPTTFGLPMDTNQEVDTSRMTGDYLAPAWCSYGRILG